MNLHPASHPPDVEDPVVSALLRQNIVTSEQVAEAWRARRSLHQLGKRGPVWRYLAAQLAADREQILKIAAEEYDYKQLPMSADALLVFVRRITPCFSKTQWKAMARLGLIPIKRMGPQGVSSIWNFAANDPTAKTIHEVAHRMAGSEYTLYQASRQTIAALFTEVFLTMMELPKAGK